MAILITSANSVNNEGSKLAFYRGRHRNIHYNQSLGLAVTLFEQEAISSENGQNQTNGPNLYVVGKKVQEKKAKQASLTQVTMTSDTAVWPSVDEGPIQEAEKPTSCKQR